MFEFIRNNFREWYKAMLWLTLIGFIVLGGILGYNIGHSFGGYYDDRPKFVGLVIGLGLGILIGVFAIIVGGGLVVTFLNIDENIQEIKNNLNNSDETISE